MNHPAVPGFFARRWHGQMPLAVLFWRDMIGFGSLINVAASILALILAAQGVPTGVAAAVHFAPLPANLFLFGAVWRNGRRWPLIQLAALLWVVAATFV